ncbi:MAG: tRNA uridine-5-carboxymethylaminomethyl(34) synthesis GTPase MnmE [Syntrophobacteraceae bacterium CG2_30_61_12]|nr:MAG: tRNA uridine-5-carboxymethylaminomethyl(34) synthesis GTPase MnmE [Syntrophobacteraceae bacterium CG2_30_61_12]
MDLSKPDDTICAPATTPGEAGIGIIKLSGPEAVAIVQPLFETNPATCRWQSHRLYYGWIRDPDTDCRVDEVLVSCMRAPHSYTGEDVVEINCHSGFAVLNRILQLVLAGGARLADPGEFTRRAFLSGRIDLTQAEAVADIIRSRSERSLEIAGRQLRGELRGQVGQWRELGLDLQARIEAGLDFTDDLDQEPRWRPPLMAAIQDRLLPEINQLIEHYSEQRILRDGLALVLVGRPNVGKSSWLNALVGKERAIVTPIPGTTRDVIEDSLNLAGVQVKILDTAGIRGQADPIEAIGIERALESLGRADLALWLIDRSEPLSAADDLIHRHLQGRPWIGILNKSDLPAALTMAAIHERYQPGLGLLELSALDPEAPARLKDHLRNQLLDGIFATGTRPFVPNLRQQQALAAAAAALRRAAALANEGGYPELINSELEACRKCFDAILGTAADGDLLDRIFSQFCIGK